MIHNMVFKSSDEAYLRRYKRFNILSNYGKNIDKIKKCKFQKKIILTYHKFEFNKSYFAIHYLLDKL